MYDTLVEYYTLIGVWIARTHSGDIASVAGVVISIVGFVATLINTSRSRSAARRAEVAANAARDRIRLFDLASDFSAAISAMDEIKRLHREGAWSILPERYSELRKLLVTVRRANPTLSQEDSVVIQTAIQHLSDIEAKVERAIEEKTAMRNVARINTVMSTQIDKLHEVLVNLRATAG